MVDHDATSLSLELGELESLGSNIYIHQYPYGGRHRLFEFSLVERYVKVIEWLNHAGISYEWITNLSGQCYPTRPLALRERAISEGKTDGLLEHFEVLKQPLFKGIQEWQNRYYFKYLRTSLFFSDFLQRRLARPERFFNTIQPFVRINSAFGLSIGLKAISSPFSAKFVCFGGSFFKTLRRRCAEYFAAEFRNNIDLFNYFRTTRNPDEAYMQTVLVNSGFFKFSKSNELYVDFSEERDDGHPKILISADYPRLTSPQFSIARKFDIAVDSAILDALDRLLEHG